MGVVLNPMEIIYWLPADRLKLSNQVIPWRSGKPHKSIQYKPENICWGDDSGYRSQVACETRVSPPQQVESSYGLGVFIYLFIYLFIVSLWSEKL